ncbi:MAG: HlyC/CorC family transporter [SAR202 cluster bacterium]|jgi:putative hemolysin|nr:hemolysin family protein [SAR202 cluster bacterium]HAL49378.1 HlyC/CorC family transporter [Dehalococcoidia bacterium]MDP6664244.1 hemolysin family protein [SAR202 cluster bacterium]MDP6799431.1 hemolysin family protein [SAR202 cluster bacterium]MQG57908.1 HlyC/CorC family transporter [SAR202 cluster bacterium]|tara:strand:- start:2202 stop:3491 length:1290 start_codon:yes stop_codon:yes gene_type:complete
MLEDQTVNLILVAVFLVFSAFFASSEAAFLSLQRTRIAHLVSIGYPGARRVASMVGQPERLLPAILLGNNLVNVAFTSVITVTVVSYVGEGNEGRGVAIATFVATAALLLLGEIIPKTVAVRKSEQVAFFYALPLKWTEYLLLPFVLVLQWTTRRLNAILGGPSSSGSITEFELRSLIDIGEAEGAFEASEAEMLENVFRFGDQRVREVMTPRTEIQFLQRGSTLQEFLEVYAENAHTRFPIYDESPDNIVGIISAKDILKRLASGDIEIDQTATDDIREALFVPETKRISELFDELRHSGNQMAMIIDEFGGMAGLVTLKRLLEVVVGPVGEESEAPEEEYREIDENTFIVDGGMSIQEASEELAIELPEGEFETIAGFALDVLGHIPSEGESFEQGNLKLEIAKMEYLKIERIRITKTEQTKPTEGE